MARLQTIAEVIDFCKAENLPANVVGRWVWITFAAKPSVEIRDKMKAAGFRWVKPRGSWAHDCGFPSTRGVGNPRFKYGSIPVSTLSREDYACSDAGYEEQCERAVSY